MPAHARYTDAELNTLRTTLKFTRPDLLYTGTLFAPDGTPFTLPRNEGRKKVGPTILDMIERVMVEQPLQLPAPSKAARQSASHQVAVKSVAVPPKKPQPVLTWRIRPSDSFFDFDAEAPAGQRYTLKSSLVSGGELVTTGAHADFLRVDKLTTISLNEVAFKLAIGIMGSIEQAHEWITGLARDAWADDLTRSAALYDAIRAAGGSVPETPELRSLRPISSVSGDIEHVILRQACTWLGVDPDMDCSRKRGRPRTSTDAGTTEAGKFIAVTISRAGELSARMVKEYRGIPSDIELVAVPLLMLVEMLGALRGDHGTERDADLLEAYLDATAPDWRNAAGAGPQVAEASFTATAEADAYEILGVAPGTPFEEVTKAYRATMQRIHPDTTNLPRYLSALVAAAYRKIKGDHNAQSAGSAQEEV